MNEHLFYFRPGEEAKLLARLQFGLERSGKCGAIMTYPIKGFPWRRNPVRSYEFHVSPEEARALFDEVATMRESYPAQCLAHEALWSDQSEKANGITRHAKTGKLCHTIAIFRAPGDAVVTFAMEEDSVALHGSQLYRTITALTGLYETLPTGKAEPDASPIGGPAEPSGNVRVGGGPPSVS